MVETWPAGALACLPGSCPSRFQAWGWPSLSPEGLSPVQWGWEAAAACGTPRVCQLPMRWSPGLSCSAHHPGVGVVRKPPA